MTCPELSGEIRPLKDPQPTGPRGQDEEDDALAAKALLTSEHDALAAKALLTSEHDALAAKALVSGVVAKAVENLPY